MAQLTQLIADEEFELAGEIQALLDALAEHGHLIEGDSPGAPSHPLVISRFQTFALRRTPTTRFTPYADRPPVIRIFYVWFDDRQSGHECAVVLEMGDKANAPNQHQWYPPIKERIELEHIPDWERRFPHHKAQIRRTR